MEKNIPAHIVQKLKMLRYGNPQQVLQEVNLGFRVVLLVGGDPENGGYEWVIDSPPSQLEFSDCGYGQSPIALRDGLVTYFGIPKLSTDVELAPGRDENKHSLKT